MSDTTTHTMIVDDPEQDLAPDDASKDLEAITDLIESNPSFVTAVREYYARKRIDYLARTSEIEALLGFLEGEGDLGTRLHNLERFVGIKPA